MFSSSHPPAVRTLWFRPPLVLLVLYGVVLLYGTLSPFHFTWHPNRDRLNLRRHVEWIPFTRPCPTHGIVCPRDTGLNLAMFIPVGVLVALMPGAGMLRRTLRAGVFGFCLSLLIETIQYFIPVRFPSATDLVLNTLGACLGGAAIARLFRSRSPVV